MSGLPPILIELKAISGEFSTKIGEAKAELGELETEGNAHMAGLANAGKLAAVGVAALGVAFVAGSVLSVKAGAEYQESMVGIGNAANLSDADVSALGDGFLDTMGKSTFSANEMAAAFAPVAGVVKQLNGGVLDAASSIQFMTSAQDVAEASGLDLKDTTASLSKVMLAYGIDTAGADDASNLLYTTSKLTGIGFDDMATAVDKMHMKLGPLAPSLDDTSTLLVDLNTHGISGARGIAAADGAMTNLLSGSKNVTGALDGLGIELLDENGHFKGMGDIIGELQPKMVGMSDAQRLQTEQALFGKTAAVALNDTIMAGADGFTKSGDAIHKNSTVQEDAAAKAATFGGQVKTLTATAEDLATKFGMVLIPYLQKTADVVLSLVKFFQEHEDITRILAIAIGSVLVAGLIAAGVAFTAMAIPIVAAAAPVILIVGLIAGLAVGMAYLYQTVTPIRTAIDALKSTFSAFTTAFNTDPSASFIDRVKNGFTAFLPVLGAALANLGTALGTWISDAAPPMLTKIAAFGQSLFTWLIGTGLPLLVSALGNLASALIEWIGPKIPGILASIGNFLGAVVSWILDTGLPLLGKTLGTLAQSLVEWIGPKIPGIVKSIEDFLSALVGWILGTGVPKLFAAMVNLAESLAGWILPKLPGLLLDLAEFALGIVSYLAFTLAPQLVNGALDIGNKIVQGIIDGIERAASSLLESIRGLLGRAVSAASGAVKDIGSTILGGLGLPHAANGMLNSPGGITLVGENGPELVNLPRGSDVFSNPKTMAMLGGGQPVAAMTSGGQSSGSGDVHIHINGAIYGGPAGLQELGALMRTELQRTGLRIGSVGLG